MTDDDFEDAPPAKARGRYSTFEDLADGPAITEGRSSRRMPHPITGKPSLFMRASRYAQTLADQYMVVEWKLGMVTIGLSKNRGLNAKANALQIPDVPMEFRRRGWFLPWTKIGKEAMDFADANNGRNLGQAIHSWAEAVERGKIKLEDVLPDWQPHIENLLTQHKIWGMKGEAEYLERLIVNLAGLPRPDAKGNQYCGLCGKFDALRRMRDGSLMVDDTKSGKNAPEGLDEIALQLAVYANAEWMWSPAIQAYVPMPKEVRKDIATITWVPINDPENTQVIPVDIAAGWETAVEVAAKALEWRARANRKTGGIRLPTAALSATMATSLPEHGPDDYEDRIMSCTGQDQISHIFMEASGLGVWTRKLDALAKLQRNKIALEHV